MTVRGMWGAEFNALANTSGRRHLDGMGFNPGGGGSASIQAGSARSGSWGYRAVSGATSPAWMEFGGDPVGPGEQVACRFYMRLNSLPATRGRIASFGDTSGGGSFTHDINLNPDGRIDFGGFPVRRPELDNPLPVGSWVRIEITLGYSTTATRHDLVAVRINGVPIYKRCSSRVISGSGPNDRLLVGWIENPGGARTMHIDDVTITEGVWPGDGQVLRLPVINNTYEDGWVPGMWYNVDGLAPAEMTDNPGTPPDCDCGIRQSGEATPESVDSGLIAGMNAAPPVGVIADSTILRNANEDKMVSTPGTDLYNYFLGYGGGSCAGCGIFGKFRLWQYRVHLHRFAGDGGYFRAELAVNGGPIRAANWRAAVAKGSVFPIGNTATGQGDCKIRLPALEPAVVNFNFDTDVGEGGNWPTNWSTIQGPMHQNPGAGALTNLEWWRESIDPTTDAVRGQVCIFTVVIDSSTGAEELPICQPLMSWI